MDEAVIRVENLGIRFRMDKNKTTNFKEYLVRMLKRQNVYTDFWALRNLSFEVRRGEVIGIIGHNGAGKSTLLKSISRIIEPTEGSIERKGRIVPMLELGSGFDYELTGMENVYINGAVLGFTRKFIKEHYQEIVDYSEIGDFISMPLKTYSSGMIARLAFSIATMVKPEILIVDEILSVGDERFQEKSYQRMMTLMQGGTTVLFVSHNIKQIRQMCNRVLWLDHGKMRMCGDAEEVCTAYSSQI